MDARVQSTVWQILHLPKDTLNASVDDGGLGLPSMLTRIQRLRLTRLLELQSSNDKVILGMLDAGYKEKQFARLTKTQSMANRLILNVKDESNAWAQVLHSTVDDGGLVEFASANPRNAWLRDPSLQIKGGDFVKAVAVRLNTLKTPSRAAQGRNISNLC